MGERFEGGAQRPIPAEHEERVGQLAPNTAKRLDQGFDSLPGDEATRERDHAGGGWDPLSGAQGCDVSR